MLSSSPSMTGQIVPWRTLGLLAALVLLAHALVLQTRPARFGPAPGRAELRVPVLVTRSIPPAPPAASPPPAVATPQVQQAAQPVAKPARKPVFKPKVPVAQAPPAPPAIDSIAESIQTAGSADAQPAPAGPDSAPPAPSATEAAPALAADSPAAAAATPPASAAPEAPPQSGQTPVTAMALPASVQLEYKMTGSAKGLTYYAKGELVWQNSGGSYNARMTAKALFIGSRTLSSTGQLSDQGLAPSRFSDKSRSEVAAHFEPDKGQISFSANTPSVPWTPGAQDRVSVILQLGGMLAGNPAEFPAGSSISMLTVGPRDADHWTFLVEGEEPLSLPFGDMATLKLSRQPRREYDQKVEIWYAPALGYLPVRNKITQANGDFVDQQLSGLSRP
ncbi:MAG: DUF3108 domain-containing protein [Burkholderiales bacterium]|nr:DUF3108 domain-containing protein [Burkholderiales bacterium]